MAQSRSGNLYSHQLLWFLRDPKQKSYNPANTNHFQSCDALKQIKCFLDKWLVPIYITAHSEALQKFCALTRTQLKNRAIYSTNNWIITCLVSPQGRYLTLPNCNTCKFSLYPTLHLHNNHSVQTDTGTILHVHPWKYFVTNLYEFKIFPNGLIFLFLRILSY